jgi:hypothetical protein
MFCPKCKSEYRAGFTRCSDCSVPLVDRLPHREHVAELVRVRSFSNDGELFLAKSVLESAGIEAMVGPPAQPIPTPRSFGLGVPATELYVRAADFVIANEILITASADPASSLLRSQDG